MKNIKLLAIVVLASATLFTTACHTAKKHRSNQPYMSLVYKELKRGLKDAEVTMKGDTVKVIYPEIAMFDFGKDQIKADALPSFRSFASVLKDYRRVYFYINGYTDNVGGGDMNLALSQRRSENTKTLMENNGIANARMTTNGMGEAYPVMTNTTAEGRQANRRVEFVLYENKTAK